jgi:hypothetical protein
MQKSNNIPAPIRVKVGQTITRSVLEGRWATCLSELGVAWMYEPKLWNLPSGRYLPDFWLPEHGVWMEIKPSGIAIDDRRYRDLGAAGETLVLLQGSPWPSDYSATLFAGERIEPNMRLALGRCNHEELWLTRVQDCFCYPLSRYVNGDYFPLFDCAVLREAYRAASRALFETVEER